MFLRALRTVPNLEIHLGNYQETVVWRPLAKPPRRGSRFVQVLWSEEKGSDVNLATQLLIDTYEGRCQRAAVFSNDSDLAMPISVAAERLDETARKLKNVATEYRPIKDRTFAATLFADELRDQRGAFSKPEGW